MPGFQVGPQLGHMQQAANVFLTSMFLSLSSSAPSPLSGKNKRKKFTKIIEERTVKIKAGVTYLGVPRICNTLPAGRKDMKQHKLYHIMPL